MPINKIQATQRRRIQRLLRDVFGVDALRGGQQEVITSVLAGRDTLAIMPTGSGKSLCYQIPAALLGGLTIVVSPLISLMKDQLEKLDAVGVAAVQVHSGLTREEEELALARIRNDINSIIFCTPERLTSPDFLALLKPARVALMVVDEAHCISQWGHDFRPAYLELGAALAALGRPPLLALTATATEDVINDIARQLGAPRIHVVNTGIYRPNLHYRVIQVTNPDQQYAEAMRLVHESSGVGIVYAATVKAVEQLHDLLLAAGESVTCYHGKLPARQRKERQEQFMNGERRVMIATNAFGMGIDKSDTRFVVHLQVPANLEAYYQESGRAGRDGLAADCTLLYYQADKRVQQFFLVKHYPVGAELMRVYDAACELARQGPFHDKALKALLDDVPDSKLKVCLKLLKDGKLLRQNRQLKYHLPPQAPAAAPKMAQFEQLAQVYADKQERDHAALEQMVAYAQSGYCRWRLLLDYFGDSVPGFEQCCQCDNCLSPPAAQIDDVDDCVFELPAPTSDQGLDDIGFAIGSRVKVPKFDIGTVLSVAGDKVTIEFPENTTKTFMAEFVSTV